MEVYGGQRRSTEVCPPEWFKRLSSCLQRVCGTERRVIRKRSVVFSLLGFLQISPESNGGSANLSPSTRMMNSRLLSSDNKLTPSFVGWRICSRVLFFFLSEHKSCPLFFKYYYLQMDETYYGICYAILDSWCRLIFFLIARVLKSKHLY